jgi:hypothetical protein
MIVKMTGTRGKMEDQRIQKNKKYFLQIIQQLMKIQENHERDRKIYL